VSITKAELKTVKSLLTGKGRKATGRFVAEGIRLLEEANRLAFLPEQVFYSVDLLGERGDSLVAKFKRRNVNCQEIAARDLRSMAGTQAPQGTLGVFRRPQTELAELYHRKYRRLLWCENIADPGNLGTLLRSALAFGFELIVVTGHSADVYSPKVVRASAGSIFGLKIALSNNLDMLDLVRRNRISLVATKAEAKGRDYSLKKVFENAKLVLAIGGEAEGLSSDVTERAEVTVNIAHSKKVESLNAGVAGSILMERIYRYDKERS